MTDLFNGLPQQVSIDRQIEGVEREIRMRERVYPRRVAENKMSQDKAANEIAVMYAVLDTLQRVRDGADQ